MLRPWKHSLNSWCPLKWHRGKSPGGGKGQVPRSLLKIIASHLGLPQLSNCFLLKRAEIGRATATWHLWTIAMATVGQVFYSSHCLGVFCFQSYELIIIQHFPYFDLAKEVLLVILAVPDNLGRLPWGVWNRTFQAKLHWKGSYVNTCTKLSHGAGNTGEQLKPHISLHVNPAVGPLTQLLPKTKSQTCYSKKR